MNVYIWPMVLIVIGVLSLLSFIIFFIRDVRLKTKFKKKEKVLVVNWGFLLLSFASFGIGVYVLFLLQAQSNLLT